ncbi:hypothetical protein L226DRAFT_264534 [Lentinus tigrinus ALCF2SS1-7]|uniref:Uncharacterized protein n=1 Tax=Lentinus tigrinus ALCF2SS1-6 TaxID=1328759 RepID=A0A5C2S511_9APHY|nr:hypothetical protein L227DRAFT_177337 [Lentinus tigrinus ALCF2SS1-6]RPD69787.1 hypothetical protein L226DRAFT_264534 [Lentinus tigrinus ALCF2SS1-7]
MQSLLQEIDEMLQQLVDNSSPPVDDSASVDNFSPVENSSPGVDNSSSAIIPRMIPLQFLAPMVPFWLELIWNPFSFCVHEQGISLQAILDLEMHQEWYWILGMPDSVMPYPGQTWLHVSWPGYRQYTHTVLLEHNRTTWSIARAIARAYESFLQEAREWDFEPNEGAEWQITGEPNDVHTLANLRLHRLCWVNGEIYQADVELVVPRD